jgi:hypothetical protein
MPPDAGEPDVTKSASTWTDRSAKVGTELVAVDAGEGPVVGKTATGLVADAEAAAVGKTATGMFEVAGGTAVGVELAATNEPSGLQASTRNTNASASQIKSRGRVYTCPPLRSAYGKESSTPSSAGHSVIKCWAIIT